MWFVDLWGGWLYRLPLASGTPPVSGTIIPPQLAAPSVAWDFKCDAMLFNIVNTQWEPQRPCHCDGRSRSLHQNTYICHFPPGIGLDISEFCSDMWCSGIVLSVTALNSASSSWGWEERRPTLLTRSSVALCDIFTIYGQPSKSWKLLLQRWSL